MSVGVRAAASSDEVACQAFFEVVGRFARLHAVKLYRLAVPMPDGMPVLPCLDHEAMLHEGISPHAAVYIEDLEGGGLHEVVYVPARRRIEVDVASTIGEHSKDSHAGLLESLRRRFPDHRIVVHGPSWLRGEQRVARACRAQVPLRDILMSEDFVSLRRSLEQLETISALMEKESRVASWSVRTLTGPLLAAAGVVSYQVLETLTPWIGAVSVQGLQYLAVGTLGAAFLYFGLKAVHLTEMANRVWKRCAEYSLILEDRERQARRPSDRAAVGSSSSSST